MATIFLALAVSLDGLGVGFSYGLRKIRLPWFSLVLIALISAAASLLSMAAGQMVSQMLNPQFAGRLGALILLALGVAIIFEAYLKQGKPGSQTLLKFNLPRFGLVIQILKEPSRADCDFSGSICSREALTLGVALALDALGIGFGAAAAGFSLILVPLCIGLGQLSMVAAGMFLGRRWQLESLGYKGAAIPGLILIALGLWRF